MHLYRTWLIPQIKCCTQSNNKGNWNFSLPLSQARGQEENMWARKRKRFNTYLSQLTYPPEIKFMVSWNIESRIIFLVLCSISGKEKCNYDFLYAIGASFSVLFLCFLENGNLNIFEFKFIVSLKDAFFAIPFESKILI